MSAAARSAAWVTGARGTGLAAGAIVAALICPVGSVAAAAARPTAAPGEAADVRERTFAPTPGVVRAPLFPFRGVHGPVTDQRRPGPARAGASTATVDFTGGRVAVRRAVAYETLTGGNVWISVSQRYSVDPRADRGLVDFVESLIHGDELGGLRIVVLRSDEIAGRCGVGVAACYFPAYDTIVVVGEDRFGGLPTDYVLAHEYGHRVAQYSSNPPFRGGAFWHGPKRWASRVGVCQKVRRGVLSIAPSAYWNFPGEIFAEAYARLHIRGQVRWQYSPFLRPGTAAFQAIRRDVKTPWLRPRVHDFKATLPPHGVATYRFRTPLDGRFTADLYAAGRSRFGFELRVEGRGAARASRPTRDFRLSRLICGDRALSLTVRAGARGGSYRLVIERP